MSQLKFCDTQKLADQKHLGLNFLLILYTGLVEEPAK